MTRTARRLTFVAAVLVPAFLLMFYSNFEGFGRTIGPIMGILLMAIFWASIIGGGIWLAVHLTGVNTRGGFGKRDEAVSILRERFARGEIERTEYFQMKQDLESDS